MASPGSISTGSPLMLPEVATSGPPKSLYQQMVQRTVRQHQREVALTRRDGRSDHGVDALRYEHNRSCSVEK